MHYIYIILSLLRVLQHLKKKKKQILKDYIININNTRSQGLANCSESFQDLPPFMLNFFNFPKIMTILPVRRWISPPERRRLLPPECREGDTPVQNFDWECQFKKTEEAKVVEVETCFRFFIYFWNEFTYNEKLVYSYYYYFY